MERFNGCRKKVLFVLSGLMAAVMVVVTFCSHMVPVTVMEKVQEVNVSKDKYKGDEMFLDKKPQFRTKAKFKILEIVPYRGMAEMGYAIDGEEPADIRQMDYEYYNNQFRQNIHHSTNIVNWITEDGKPENTGHLENQNAFIKTTLKAALKLSNSEVKSYIDNHSVDVVVVEPKQINAHPELIDQADFITVHDDFAKQPNDYFKRFIHVFETYGYEAACKTLKKKYDGCQSNELPKFNYGATDDLSMDVIKKLFCYGLIDEQPLALPGHVVKPESVSTNTNLMKLGYAVSVARALQDMGEMNIQDVYHNLFEVNHKDSWDFWEFKPMVEYLCPNRTPNERDEIVNKVRGNYDNTVDNEFVGSYTSTTVFAYAHGAGVQSSFISKMAQSDSYDKSIQTSAEEDWCKEVGNDTRDASICIYNGLRPTMRVLDIEPDDKFNLSTLDVKAWIPEDIKIKVEVVPMTMSEFVGIVNDLNSDYDMIYFGKNVNRMNGGKIYYKAQDAFSESLYDLQGEGATGPNFLYSGNDITERMVKKVEAFMNANYPVLYDPDLIEGSKVNVDTNIYKFLLKHHSNMYEVIDGKHLGGSGNKFVNKANLVLNKPKIYHTLNSLIDEYYTGTTQSVGAGGLAGLEFNTRFGSGSYKANLYVDGDHNGVFNEWVRDGSGYRLDSNYEKPIWSANFNAGTSVTVSSCTIPQAAMLGVVSYKLEVVKLDGSGNPTGVRSNVTGNIMVTHPQKEIRVLQLSDLTKYPEMDLSGSSKAATEFKKFADSSYVTNRFHIVVDAKDITKSLDEVDFMKYDVIILGFINPGKKLASADGILNKLTIAASKGKGVIFTQDAITQFNDTSSDSHYGANVNYRARRLLGLDRFEAFSSGNASAIDEEMAFTYNVLNLYSSRKYFSGMATEVQYTNALERVNEAKVERYPYVIGTDPTGFNATSGIYQTDVEQKSKSELDGVCYFCLSGKNSIGDNFTVSPRDIRNNYYLWRNDSVFYSGVSRVSFNGAYDNEVKLFVNTIISAFGLERSVNIDVTNLSQVDDFAHGKSYIMYADIDRAEKDDVIEKGHQPVKFNLSLKGFAGANIEISFYQADSDGNKQSGPIPLYHDGNKFAITGSGTKETKFTVQEGKEYIFNYPYKYLLQGANENILIEAKATKGGKEADDAALVKVLRRAMFDLD